MSFVSPEFALLLLMFLPIYWGLYRKKNAQLRLLTLSSLAIYATWTWTATLLFIGFSVYIWLAGRWLNSTVCDHRNSLRLQICVVISLAALLATKYYEFARHTMEVLAGHFGLDALMPIIDIAAPAGISFYTFQAITYLVWRFESPPTAIPFDRTLLFLSFWPTLFSGPILRAKDFFHQIELEQMGKPLQCERAVYLLLLGLTQKLVLSNWLEESFVTNAFRYPGEQDFLSGTTAIWAYSLQIFFDFAGYTSIVTGLALLLGYELPVNFRQPYLAKDLRDFWQRWHISLSTFIRDYIYIPLGGSRSGKVLTQRNVLIAMLLSGIWHGANATFAIWGLLHGLGIIWLNLYQQRVAYRLPVLAGQILTWLYVGLAWTFFRADSLDDAFVLLSTLGSFSTLPGMQHTLLLLLSFVYLALSRKAAVLESWSVDQLNRLWGWPVAVLSIPLVYCIILLGPTGVPSFIYYRF